jgi:Tfp pilus assembly protein PilF
MDTFIVKQVHDALRTDDFSTALRIANQLVSEEPGNGLSQSLLARVFYEMGNWNKAIEHYDRAISNGANSAEVYFDLGMAYEMKDDYQSARNSFQVALKLEPGNNKYKGHYGRLLYERGQEHGNVNLKNEGRQLMEQAIDQYTDNTVKDQLAIVYLNDAYKNWKADPTDKDSLLATEKVHVDEARYYINLAKSLQDGSNTAIVNKIVEMDKLNDVLEGRTFGGYWLFVKVAGIAAFLCLASGSWLLGIYLAILTGGYYFSQLMPGYFINRMQFKQDYRPPFMVRQIDRFTQMFEGITFFGSSLGNVLFRQWMFGLLIRLMTYLMILIYLPFEIIRGFLTHYEVSARKSAVVVFLFLAGQSVAMAQPGTTLVFDDFESANWVNEIAGTPNISGNQGVVDIVDGLGVDGSRAVVMGKLQGDTGFTGNGLDISYNLTNVQHVKLTFDMYNFDDESQNEDGIWMSDDNGASFVQVYRFYPGDWCNNQWGQFPPFDINQLAQKHGLMLNNQVVIRIMQYDNEDFSGSSVDGFYIDNLRLYTQAPEYKKITLGSPLEETFEVDYLNNNWMWRFADSTATLSNRPTQISNLVGLYNGIGTNGSRALAMGIAFCDNKFLTNAIDIHLDFSALSAPQKRAVELRFDVWGNDDETQIDDAIFLSNDGGNHFTKLIGFNPGEWCNNIWGQYPPLQIGEIAQYFGIELTDRCVLRIQQHDDEDFSGSGIDGLYIDNLAVYVRPVSYFPVTPGSNGYFEESFEALTWADNCAWRSADSTTTLVSATASPFNVVGIADNIGVNGSRALFMGKRACDDVSLSNAFDVHLDCSDLTPDEKQRLELTFDLYDYDDETQIDDGIFMSDDGGKHWEKVFELDPSGWCDFVYGAFPPLQLSALAQAHGLILSDQLIVRFQQFDNEDFAGSSVDGFYIDNIRVYVAPRKYATVPFSETFESGLGEMWSWSFADNPATPSPDLTDISNIVVVQDALAFNNSQYSLFLGKRFCDGDFITNAADLRLNLNGASGVKLSFWLYNNDDETQIQDGIYLSNNGGQSFTKVFSFDLSNTPNYTWQKTELNLDVLSATYGISYTANCIVRFVQHDDEDFSGSSQDGYFIDDINVMSAVPTSSIIDHPFSDAGTRIWPNPAQDKIYIHHPGLEDGEVTYCRIFDHCGLLLSETEMEIKGDIAVVGIEHIPNGNFYLQIWHETGWLGQKFIKIN